MLTLAHWHSHTYGCHSIDAVSCCVCISEQRDSIETHTISNSARVHRSVRVDNDEPMHCSNLKVVKSALKYLLWRNGRMLCMSELANANLKLQFGFPLNTNMRCKVGASNDTMTYILSHKQQRLKRAYYIFTHVHLAAAAIHFIL